MQKKEKTATDNQWAAPESLQSKESCECKKQNKTEQDNQWTSTCKNCPS
jgi:hypothetical protein